MGKSSWTRKRSSVPVPAPRKLEARDGEWQMPLPNKVPHWYHSFFLGHQQSGIVRRKWANRVGKGTIKEDPSHSLCGLLSVSSAASY